MLPSKVRSSKLAKIKYHLMIKYLIIETICKFAIKSELCHKDSTNAIASPVAKNINQCSAHSNHIIWVYVKLPNR